MAGRCMRCGNIGELTSVLYTNNRKSLVCHACVEKEARAMLPDEAVATLHSLAYAIRNNGAITVPQLNIAAAVDAVLAELAQLRANAERDSALMAGVSEHHQEARKLAVALKRERVRHTQLLELLGEAIAHHDVVKENMKYLEEQLNAARLQLTMNHKAVACYCPSNCCNPDHYETTKAPEAPE